MCGIAGISRSTSSVEKPLLTRMCDSIDYRGPDNAGVWVDRDSKIGFGHRRLSILDLSSSGHQPMTDQINGNVITYNGEVYNYIEVRNDLKKLGYQFTTGTDTEVILKAYAEYGESCVNHFNGMFAFAIWDNVEQQIFMARDRLGIKPFYYLLTEKGDLYFSSEVKAIRIACGGPTEINTALIDDYMSFGYIPGENTLEKGIMRLLPGHRATFKSGVFKSEKYWDLEFSNEQDLGFDYYFDQTKELLDSAIDLRLRSDVPVGIFLSGGIDSSAVVGLLAQRSRAQLKTFSVAYDFGKDFNETQYAKAVSKRFNTEHHELFLTTQDFKDFIPDFTYLMDEPVTESAAISLQFLSQFTKEHATVVLSGEGSDEIFGGYDLYRYMKRIEQYRKILGDPAAKLVSDMASKFLPGNHKLLKYLKMSTQSLEKRYKGISTYEDRYKQQLYRPEFEHSLSSTRCVKNAEFLNQLFDKTADQDVLSRMLYFDTKTWLVDDLLIKADRMSMAASLELRVPFLDYRLVEFAATIPSKYKVRNGQGKYILKKMMEGILPKEIIYRTKMGFPTPLKIMFQGGLAEYAQDTLASASTNIHQYFDKSSIQEILNEHFSGSVDHHRVLWQLVVLEEWLKGHRLLH